MVQDKGVQAPETQASVSATFGVTRPPAAAAGATLTALGEKQLGKNIGIHIPIIYSKIYRDTDFGTK